MPRAVYASQRAVLPVLSRLTVLGGVVCDWVQLALDWPAACNIPKVPTTRHVGSETSLIGREEMARDQDNVLPGSGWEAGRGQCVYCTEYSYCGT